MEIKRAHLEDIPELVDFLSKTHFKESVYDGKVEFCKETCAATFAEVISNPNSLPILVKKDSEFVGFAAVYISKTYYKQTEAEFGIFYVNPKYRGSGVSRLMVELGSNFAKQSGASIIYASSGTGMNDNGKNDKLWINLFKKNDYQILGTEMVRFL